MIQHKNDRYSLYTGNCLEEMKNLDDNSVDSVVTDPPYGLSNHKPEETVACLTAWLAGEPYVKKFGGFMGKTWDSWVPGPEIWREVLRVLKPGGHALIFAGTRSMDLMSMAVRLSGFEYRDTIMWVYGCLDTTTECLTRSGWKCYTDLSTDDEVMQWDASTGSLSWTHPEEVMIYPYKGEMINLSNRHTDQMLTPNHRVYSKVRNHSRNPKPVGYDVVEAGNLKNNWQVTLPMAGELQGSRDIDPDYAYIVGWWLTDAWAHGDGKAIMFSQSKPETLLKLREALSPYNPSEYVKKAKKDTHNEEHTFYVTGDIASKLIAEFPGRRLLWDVLDWSYDARKRLFDGLMDGDGSLGGKDRHAVAFWSKNQDRRDVFGVLALSLGYRTYEDQKKGCVHVNLSTSTTQIQSKHRVDPVKYEGDVWCVRVPNGAFVVRRCGKPFITGNSGFPKSLDVSKAIDKRGGANVSWFGPWFRKWRAENGIIQKQVAALFPSKTGGLTGCVANWELGFNLPTPEQFNLIRDTFGLPFDTISEAEREVVGKHSTDMGGLGGQRLGQAGGDITTPATPEAQQWDGWGTALKPAWEPIIVARKPVEGTVAENVLKYGTGAINVDECRVETAENLNGGAYAKQGQRGGLSGDERDGAAAGMFQAGKTAEKEYEQPKGRFPANLTHDGSDQVTRLFPVTKSARAGFTPRKGGNVYGGNSLLSSSTIYQGGMEYGDSGSAARFFYQAKVSKRDRNEGLDKVVLIDIESLTCEENTTNSEKLARLLVATEPLPPRVTAEYGTGNKSVTEWSITLFGKALTEQCPTANKSTTSTGISSTIESRILNSLTRYITSASIPGVSLETENGGSRAASAENSNTLTITISEKMALALGVKSAKNGTRLRISASEGRNVHSTVKPTDLMRYLVRLVTPHGGTVLDPFMGSGSTGKAAMLEGFRFIGIDLSDEYVAISEARIKYAYEHPENYEKEPKAKQKKKAKSNPKKDESAELWWG